MRGDVRIVDDSAVDDKLMATKHLILFGDPGSNAVLKKIVGDLPLEWTKDRIRIGEQEWASADHGLSLIFPNPLNPSKYVVINSGHTFHDKEFRSTNANLFPRLGDWAMMKILPGSDQWQSTSLEFPEEVIRAGYFDETWHRVHNCW